MFMRAYSKTDIGKKRQVNQDYVYTIERKIGPLPNLFIVADGMGGHKSGDFASRYTVEILCNEVLHSHEEDPETLLRTAIETANRKVIEAASKSEELYGMGTTVVAATIVGDKAYFANVGDSRLYLINRRIKQLTNDHSLVEEMVRLGGIKPEEARYHPDKNIITRAVGADKEVQVDTYGYTLEPGDIILMCTDGLSNMVDDDAIHSIVRSGRDPVEKIEELIRIANENGGRDNIGIVLIEPLADEVDV